MHSKPIHSQDDFQPGTRLPKMDSKPIWIVRITMPRNLLSDILSGSIDIGDKRLDFTELDHAYDADLDKGNVKDMNPEQEQMAEPQQAPMGMPQQAPMGMPQGMPPGGPIG